MSESDLFDFGSDDSMNDPSYDPADDGPSCSTSKKKTLQKSDDFSEKNATNIVTDFVGANKLIFDGTYFESGKFSLSVFTAVPLQLSLRGIMSREVLSPPLYKMGPHRNYRLNLVHEDFGNQFQQQQQRKGVQQKPQQGYVEQDLYAEDDDEGDMNDCLIEELPNSLYKLTMHVAQSFYGGLIGFKGQTKRRIETETKTEIYIPRNNAVGRKDENVVVKGKSRSSVCAARRQINLLLHSLRKRMSATHFVEVPLNFGEIRENFVKFKQHILEANLGGVEEGLFIPETRLHITFTVCVLLDDAERAKANELLQSCRQYLHDLHPPFEVKVSGLEIMNDDPSAVRVVYARIEAPELQIFGDRCLEPFLRSGLARDEYERKNVKMHMTVLNVKYLKKTNPNTPNSFDAREILKRFGNFYFGTTQINEVRLSIRGSYYEEGSNRGFYKTSSNLQF